MDFIYNLKEIQENFLNYIYNSENSPIINQITPEANLEIYKNSILNTQIDALNTLFETTSEYLTKNPHNLDLNYNLADILSVFVQNIPCQFDDYYQYGEIFIKFLEEIKLNPNIEYLSNLAQLDLMHAQLLTATTNNIPDYVILQNLNNLDLNKVILSAPQSYKTALFDYDVIGLWNNYVNNQNFSKYNIIKKPNTIFIAPYNNEISAIKISDNICYLLNTLNTKKLSIQHLSEFFVNENKYDFETSLLEAIQLKLININYEN